MARRRITLSQNFLYDTDAVRRVVRFSGVGPGDLVVEPGAGEGPLTAVLARTCREVVAYEIDPRLAARLARRFAGRPGVRPVRGDFLRASPPREPFAVVGNIPYSRTTDIVRWCLAAPALTSATLLTQREYARRHTGDYGRWPLLTVLSWPRYAWRLGCRVGRGSFVPAPRTDSAALRIERRAAPLLPPERLPAYRAFVEHGFTGVGGSLAATLARRHRTRRVRAVCAAAGVGEDVPVGLVAPRQWLVLFDGLDRG
ncbi:ErmE/ErmH/ErmO/ErmR family 23S rRNA (adenine(2058)-N(6))-methyltransferase [Streptomyces sp. DH37]|uniref:ErmE/ErmH/ErmO/ErmR family 23S rRNA (adenine(2058)-N(6))-methyltransferase n=1 Tax=Streptomyces sp. DH37 TaxID=3040122 RepID=UPI00244259B9|nr:ErmE/ErmH/ErmO/ErmR family 23S rRNA (adenine(2058)-N(6))-methyltransferase [Streptomyces sp. DH37]MDG9702107.1 ErmE/ErmH/ErmO/ErmR family 23S rRNA (adenine(2058)-N(6))-methyltransferase [Streptomyces sp. DH37]